MNIQAICKELNIQVLEIDKKSDLPLFATKTDTHYITKNNIVMFSGKLNGIKDYIKKQIKKL